MSTENMYKIALIIMDFCMKMVIIKVIHLQHFTVCFYEREVHFMAKHSQKLMKR